MKTLAILAALSLIAAPAFAEHHEKHEDHKATTTKTEIKTEKADAGHDTTKTVVSTSEVSSTKVKH